MRPPAGGASQAFPGLPWLAVTALLALAAYTIGAKSGRQPTLAHQPPTGDGGGSSSGSGADAGARAVSSGGSVWAETRPPATSNFSIPAQLPQWASCVSATCPYSNLQPIQGDPFQSPFTTRAQLGDEHYIWKNYFFNQTGGFYLEMGGADGVSNSNSYWLSKAAGWQGMLIEADPESYKQMAAARPEAICVNAAVCDEFKVVHHLLKAELGGIYEFMTDGFKRAWKIQVDDVNTLPTVPCVPLMYLLERFGVKEIDFWSLDVEEAELMVLEAFDFSRILVKTMVVEANGHARDKDAAVRKLLEGQGFVMAVHNQWNQVYVNKEFMKKSSKAPQ